jgi:SAM-dependent methyltransferase
MTIAPVSRIKIKDLYHLQRAVADAPAAVGVVGNLHLDDHLLHYVLNHPAFPDLASSVERYFSDGRRSALKLARLIEELGLGAGRPISLLEFASGYGRVTRHLRGVLPNASIAACDIHDPAVAFIEQELGVSAFRSDSVPEQWRVPRRYDVVFALSFYSHMPRETWSRWIRAHVNVLEDHGVLIFTTHGRLSLHTLGSPEVPEDGFWFAPRSEQIDLDTADYGTTIVTRAFVEQAIADAVGGAVALYREGFWWKHQDLYVVRRDACTMTQ